MISRNAQNKNPKNQFSFVLDSQSGMTRYYTLRGQVFANEALYMEKELERAAVLGCNRVIINMALVRAFSSAGIKVILTFYKKMKSAGGTLKIDNPSETVRNIIGMVALDELSLGDLIREITIPARLDRLNELLEFVGDAMQNVGTDEKTQNNIKIAVEEIFVNIASYAYTLDEDNVTVCLSVDWDALSITFKDNGKPYDPLGKYAAKKIMDKMSYEYRDRQNILTIKKDLAR